ELCARSAETSNAPASHLCSVIESRFLLLLAPLTTLFHGLCAGILREVQCCVWKSCVDQLIVTIVKQVLLALAVALKSCSVKLATCGGRLCERLKRALCFINANSAEQTEYAQLATSILGELSYYSGHE